MTTQQQKVVILGPSFPYRGGIADFSHRLAKSMKQSGWNVKFLTYTLQYPKLLFPGKNQYSTDPAPDFDSQRIVNSFYPLTWTKTVRAIRQINPNLVIAPHWNPVMSYCLQYILRRVSCKSVVIVHNLYPHEPSAVDRWFVKRMLSVDTTFVALSDGVYQRTKTAFSKVKLSYYPHPLYDHFGEIETKDKAAKALGFDVDYRYLLFFGLVRKYKGLDLLLKAFGKAKSKLAKTKLLVIGEFYDDKQPYLDIIKEQGLDDDVIIRDEFIPQAEVANYFNVSDAVMLTYTSASQSGISQIAGHFCKPMLVTNVGSLASQIADGNTGIVVEPTISEVAQGLQRIFDTTALRQLVENAANQKQAYTWDGLTDHITKLTRV